eukprot:scaffold68353_cov21-Prasinocladus_malaysianus.AAC.2
MLRRELYKLPWMSFVNPLLTRVREASQGGVPDALALSDGRAHGAGEDPERRVLRHRSCAVNAHAGAPPI